MGHGQGGGVVSAVGIEGGQGVPGEGARRGREGGSKGLETEKGRGKIRRDGGRAKGRKREGWFTAKDVWADDCEAAALDSQTVKYLLADVPQDGIGIGVRDWN